MLCGSRIVARAGDCFGGGLAVVGGHLLASVLDRWSPDRRSGSCHTALYKMVAWIRPSRLEWEKQNDR